MKQDMSASAKASAMCTMREIKYVYSIFYTNGRDSAIGIATPLWAGRSGDRILVEARFSAPVQAGPRAHPASYIMGTGPFLGVKRPRRGVDHPATYSAEVKEILELYLYSPSGTSWTVLGRTLSFTLFSTNISTSILPCKIR